MLTRENIRNGVLQDMIKAGGALLPLLSEDELRESWTQTLATAPGSGSTGSDCTGSDFWVFGYGSLIWNPAFHFAEKRIARLHGWHRQFCLWTHLGRGSPDRPGMVLGLERGGSCVGVAFRIAPEAIQEEVEIIWRREMVSGAYVPRWTRLATDDGSITAVSFVINREHPRYAARAPEKRIVDSLAFAAGPLGPSREYLDNTVDHLIELGINDRALTRLRRLVAERAGVAEVKSRKSALGNQ